jgi:hypothetical protein
VNGIYSTVSCAVYGDVNLNNCIDVQLSYYLHRPNACPLGLSCWFQIRSLDTVLLNWSVWTFSTCVF